MKKHLLLSLLAIGLGGHAAAQTRIAMVDTAQAFDVYYKTQQMAVRIAGERERFKKEVTTEQQEYAAEMRDAQALEQRAQDMTLSLDVRHQSDSALTAKMQDIKSLDATIEQMKKTRTREMTDELMRGHQEISDEIQKVILAYVANKGYDLILDKSAAMSNVSTAIAYRSSQIIDLTPQIIAVLNANAPIPSPMKNQ